MNGFATEIILGTSISAKYFFLIILGECGWLNLEQTADGIFSYHFGYWKFPGSALKALDIIKLKHILHPE